MKLLHKIDPNQAAAIGSAGYGKDADDFIEPGMNYCMGGTGMIFTRRLIFDIGPKLRHCIKNLQSNHEDIEIGRCIWKHTGNLCTSSIETQDLFYNNFQENRAHVGSLSNHVLEVGIIYHPNKRPAYQVN